MFLTDSFLSNNILNGVLDTALAILPAIVFILLLKQKEGGWG